MKRIKLFESFDDNITEQEIKGALVELVDNGYDVLVTRSLYDFDTKLYYSNLTKVQRNSNLGYIITIKPKPCDDIIFSIIDVSEPIIELIAYLKEKYDERLVYSIELTDIDTESEQEVEDFEQFVNDFPHEETYEVTITLRVKK